jgi:hypothetical protein
MIRIYAPITLKDFIENSTIINITLWETPEGEAWVLNKPKNSNHPFTELLYDKLYNLGTPIDRARIPTTHACIFYRSPTDCENDDMEEESDLEEEPDQEIEYYI